MCTLVQALALITHYRTAFLRCYREATLPKASNKPVVLSGPI
jgi:hypothetical protein